MSGGALKPCCHGVIAALLIWSLSLVWLSAGGALAQGTCAGLGIGTGGTVTQFNEGDQTFCVHRFTANGTFTLTRPAIVDHLIVGGGGGGGAIAGGGGGGGGIRTGAEARGAGSFTITVGAGGAGDNRTFWPTFVVPGGANGGNSSAFGVIALGGGGGGTYNTSSNVGLGRDGGSGGGTSVGGPGGQGTTGQGNRGGTGTGTDGDTSGGGGGGAGQAGSDGTAELAGRGGDGLVSSITGTAVTYAGGGAGGGDIRGNRVLPNQGGAGGGGASSDQQVAGAGTAGLGGGGAGGRAANNRVASTGGAGGSGVVILRYVGNIAPTAAAGPDITVTAGTTVALNGAGSTDPENNIIGYSWTRIAGSSGTLNDANAVQASLVTAAPAGGAASETLRFQLTVTDAFGLTSTDEVVVTVLAAANTPPPAAGGGNSVYDYFDPVTQRTFRVHVFETNGTFTLDREREVVYLVIGGGGGGGAIGGGGGGAGGMRSGSDLRAAGDYAVVVGAGGAGDNRTNWPSSFSAGQNGAPSSAFGVVANGGGGGGTYNTGSSNVGNGLSGGSGGGGSVGGAVGSGAAGQGTDGGTGTGGGGDTTGGGGGGAGQAGSNGSVSLAGRGGDGLVSTITGAPVAYAGGGAGGGDIRGNGAAPNSGGAGGGGSSNNNEVGGAGTPGLGGGGAGGRAVDDNGTRSAGGNGGSGVVILRYVVNNPPAANAGQDANAFANLAFSLDGRASTDLDGTASTGNITTYLWEQINIPAGGSAVTLTGADTAVASFTPAQPANGTSEVLTFRLTVTDAFGSQSTDEVVITLQGMADLIATKTARIFSQDGTGCDDLTASPPSEPALPAAIPGACIEYTISVENTGPVAATAIELTDNLPLQVTYAAAAVDGWTEATLSANGNSVTVTDGVIAANTTGTVAATITIRAWVK